MMKAGRARGAGEAQLQARDAIARIRYPHPAP